MRRFGGFLDTVMLNTLRRRRQAAGARDMAELCAELLSSRGEISGAAVAEEILERFEAGDDAARLAFFTYLADSLGIDPDRVQRATGRLRAEPGRAAYAAFLAAAEAPRQELIRRLNRVPGATGRLVAMRAALMRLVGRDDPVARIDIDFRHLFASWFNRGFLQLRPIGWQTSADILEKIIRYEAVHAIQSWDDLRRRVAPQDRRCFAFFHPAMPDEPLIFVEVALMRGIPGAIGVLLAENRSPIEAEAADTAVFYSISNCQAGLAGVSFGNSLIKQVVEDLAQELPGLRDFVTLSPMPGLARWLEGQGRPVAGMDEAGLRAAAARYLLEARRGDGLPVDPVARFHLGNGALIHAVHAGADLSPRGLAESGGVMVNYRYDRARIGHNHEAYAAEHRVVAAPAVVALAREGAG